MTDCIFCKMVAGQITPTKLYEDDEILAFPDINPQAPVHFLVIPKRHISSLNDLAPEDAPLVGNLYLAARQVAGQLQCAASGYRAVINCGSDAGQSVSHIHLHILAGATLGWPPYSAS